MDFLFRENEDLTISKSTSLPTIEIDNSNQWLCADGTKKIHKNWLCDTEADCKDGSDEKNCPIK